MYKVKKEQSQKEDLIFIFVRIVLHYDMKFMNLSKGSLKPYNSTTSIGIVVSKKITTKLRLRLNQMRTD